MTMIMMISIIVGSPSSHSGGLLGDDALDGGAGLESLPSTESFAMHDHVHPSTPLFFFPHHAHLSRYALWVYSVCG
jgi:hypothetical protein